MLVILSELANERECEPKNPYPSCEGLILSRLPPLSRLLRQGGDFDFQTWRSRFSSRFAVSLAAKRRKNAAHGASREMANEGGPSPEGAKENSNGEKRDPRNSTSCHSERVRTDVSASRRIPAPTLKPLFNRKSTINNQSLPRHFRNAGRSIISVYVRDRLVGHLGAGSRTRSRFRRHHP